MTAAEWIAQGKEIKGKFVTKNIFYSKTTKPEDRSTMAITGVVKKKINDWSVLVTWIMPIGDKPTEDEIKQTELLTILHPDTKLL